MWKGRFTAISPVGHLKDYVAEAGRKSGRFMNRLRRDVRGFTGIFLVGAIVPVIGIMGFATDVSRAYILKSRLSTALDAAALAGGRNFFDDNRDAQIAKYFAANFPPGFMDATVDGPYMIDTDGNKLPDGHEYSSSDTKLIVTASATMPTVFMQIFNHDDMTVSVQAEVSREVVLLDVVLAIDMSGSMNNYTGDTKRIDAAKSAALDLIDILFGGNTENPLMKIGLVPWSGKVNVTLNGTTYGKDQFGNALGSSELFTTTLVPDEPLNPYRKKFYRYDQDEDPNTGTNGNEKVVLKNYKNRIKNLYYAHNAPSVPLLTKPPTGWKGCVYARYAKRNEYPSVDHNNSSALQDAADIYDGSRHEVGGLAWLGWHPMGSEGEPKSGGNCELSDLANLSHECTSCPTAGITPLQSVKSVIYNAVDELNIPSGSYYTNIPQGLAWAWRVLSPDAPFTEGSEIPGEGFSQHKAIILLTDGANTRRAGDAYNYAISGRDQRLKDLADNIKANGTLIYTIQFANGSGSLADLMRDVASTDNHYFYAPDSNSLQAVFKQVANELSNLRLSR
ncbi:MAG: hypothetical protein CMF31_03475 [Kordiimonas sp.]|nr:hypothetical protein [Kordiimonas sp.]|tara:strand:+ start:6030 stop:7715 length:1686 start_codon:yes stop_codon:yes gene_type:complete